MNMYLTAKQHKRWQNRRKRIESKGFDPSGIDEKYSRISEINRRKAERQTRKRKGETAYAETSV